MGAAGARPITLPEFIHVGKIAGRPTILREERPCSNVDTVDQSSRPNQVVSASFDTWVSDVYRFHNWWIELRVLGLTFGEAPKVRVLTLGDPSNATLTNMVAAEHGRIRFTDFKLTLPSMGDDRTRVCSADDWTSFTDQNVEFLKDARILVDANSFLRNIPPWLA
jgi:hypothetical protein